MADKEKPKKAGFHEEFGWFIWGMVGIAALWFFTGGPDRAISHEGAFIKPLDPIDSGQAYGKYYVGTDSKQKQTLDLPPSPLDIIKKAETGLADFLTQVKQVEALHSSALTAKSVSFDDTSSAKNTNVNEEYLVLKANKYAKDPIVISDLILRGTNLKTYALIPKSTELLYLGTTNSKTNTSLPPNGQAFITTGRSPVGTSFRVNMCTGYLDQFQKYTPELKKDCPEPKLELALSGITDDASCFTFVEKLPRCKIYSGSLPNNLSKTCKTFITEKLNYNSCTLTHKTDKKFYTNEWRLFLEKNTELWAKKNEIIRLIDSKGTTLDAVTY